MADGSAAISRDRPWPARVLERRRLTARDAEKEVLHLALDLAGSGLRYAPGDTLAAWAPNPEPLVERVVAMTGGDADVLVKVGPKTLPFATALRDHLVLGRPMVRLLRALAERGAASTEAFTRTDARSPAAWLDDEAAREAWLDGRDVADLLEAAGPGRFDAASLVPLLAPQKPRSYSIASCPATHPGEVHLTVAVASHRACGQRREGLASGWLRTLDPAATRVPVFLQPTRTFRLPDDPTTDVIFVGAGTGVAPYRAFLQARARTRPSGRAWLFFGARAPTTDPLYLDELVRFRESGVLDRLDVAWSRAGERHYVQDRIRRAAAEVFAWIEGGAHVYVCGDAKGMAPGVHAALVDVIARGRAISSEEASAWITDVLDRGERRYRRDVY